ncbi:MAG: TolC family outer membrane protein [Gammaproteobacteria bacterium]|nr:TolC family outer membrane protein [Gammaproteobacteria bacterium]MBI5617311.1 TolC family outer membrane protein [Gammaproteobacteria bacterium]
MLEHTQRLLACLALAAFGAAGPARAATDLLAVMQLAEASDPQYLEAQSNTRAVGEGIPQAKALLWRPQLSFGVDASRVEQDITSATRSAFGAGGQIGFDQWDYRLAVTQPVFHYDRYVQLQEADKRVKQAQYAEDAARQALLVRASERYFNVLAAEDDLAFARAEKESLKGQLEQAQQRFQVGLVAITDVQEAQAGFDRAVASEIQARNQLDNAGEELRETAGSYIPQLVPLRDEIPLVVPNPADVEAWTETSLTQNLDLASARIAAEIAAEEIHNQYAGHLPTLDIVGGHGESSTGGRFGQTDVEQSDIGVNLNIPLYAGGLVTSRVRQAQHQHTGALDRLEQSKRAVYRQAHEAYLGVVTQISSVQALKQAVVSSQTALESTRAGYEAGTRTAVDVVTAERGLSQAKRDYARARYDYVLNVLRLKQAAGTLGPEDIQLANSWLQSSATAPATTPR